MAPHPAFESFLSLVRGERDLLERSTHRTHCPLKGDASYWNITAGGRENAAWSYERPIPDSERIERYIAFYWDKVDHWFEEDEEVFGHPQAGSALTTILAASAISGGCAHARQATGTRGSNSANKRLRHGVNVNLFAPHHDDRC
jgi:hypothetical protein